MDKSHHNIEAIDMLIAKDALDQAVNVIMKMTQEAGNKEDYKSAILLSRELYGLEKAYIRGEVCYQEKSQERGKIASRIIKLNHMVCLIAKGENR